MTESMKERDGGGEGQLPLPIEPLDPSDTNILATIGSRAIQH